MSLAARQLDLLRRMAVLEPPPVFIGGYAEDALLAGAVTRPHGDLDWIFPRHELEDRLAQAAALGFEGFGTWGEAAPGEPFYLSALNGDLQLELGITDEADGEHVLRVHKLFFDLDGEQAVVGYQVHLPSDLYTYPQVELEGIRIRTPSPLAMYQFRAGIASQGSFGPLSERQLSSMAQLRETFFPDRSEAELMPRIERLP